MKWLNRSMAALLMLGLSGCMASTTISDGNETLMKIGNTTYTRGEEYQLIKRVSGPALTLQEVQNLICDEEIGVTDEIKEEAEEMYNSYAEGNDDFETSLKDYGYESKEEYIEEVLIPTVQNEKLIDKYFVDDKEQLEAEYTPVLVRILETDSDENATRAKEALEEGTEYEAVAEQYGLEDSSYRLEETLVTKDDTTLPTEMLNSIMDTDKTGLLDILVQSDTTTDTSKYYVIDVISRDYDEILDQFIEHFANDSEMNTQAMVYYLAKYDFEVHDQYLFDYWKANNPEYLVNRPDLLEGKEN